jgi:hypothetical protein
MRILKQEGFLFHVRVEHTLDHLEEGMPIYIAEEPCSGFESYPAFYVSDAGDRKAFRVRVPWTDSNELGYGLRFMGSCE